MSTLRIAHRYAESLYGVAKQANVLDQVYADSKFLYTLSQNDELKPFLKNPLIKVEQKQAVFTALLKDKVQTETLNAVLVLTAHKREAVLAEFCNEFEKFYFQEKHISVARLVTAENISDARVQEIIAEFQANGFLDKEVRLEREVKPELIGGFVLYFNDKVYDASVAYKLELLEKQFSENLYIKNF